MAELLQSIAALGPETGLPDLTVEALWLLEMRIDTNAHRQGSRCSLLCGQPDAHVRCAAPAYSRWPAFSITRALRTATAVSSMPMTTAIPCSRLVPAGLCACRVLAASRTLPA
jgi:hypothetical protein